ncbi:MAG: peptidylprolyl isomerase [Ardenticatenaceae bacterium]|nr:peptidylprolyl isomerase [Ardenticatenaceae bacterium]
MTPDALKVADDLVVSMHYTLTLDDGEVVDSSVKGDPLQFLQGFGQIIPGLEKELYGMAIGDNKQVVVAAADGYGEVDPDAFQVVPRSIFPEELDLEEGMGLRMRDQATGQLIETYIAEIRPEEVLLDFNHPLAGEVLTFDIEITGIRPASDEELAHGHVH